MVYQREARKEDLTHSIGIVVIVLQTLIFPIGGMVLLACPERLHVRPGSRAEFAHGRGDRGHA